MKLFLRNLLFTVAVPGIVAVAVPLSLAPQRPAAGSLLFLASGLFAFGVVVYLWCVWDFATFGRGTPAPIDAPKRLVVRGLYRTSRNPMYVGVLAVILGWAALYAAPGLLVYALAVTVCFQLFIVLYEEPHLRAEFGSEYEEYRSNVGRWLPRIPRDDRSDLGRGWVLGAAAVVLFWRAAAFLRPSSFIDLPGGLRLPLALLGVLFLVCGVSAWWLRPGRWTRVFLVYGLGGGVHWGGSIGSPDAGAELSLLLVYLGLSAVAEAALLHLALIYPRGGSIAVAARVGIYAPAALAFVVATIAARVPRAVLGTIIGLILLVANLLSLVAVIVFLVAVFRVDPETGRAARPPLIVTTMLAAGAVSLVGGAGYLPGPPDAWNLVLGVIPVCLAFAVLSFRPKETGES